MSQTPNALASMVEQMGNKSKNSNAPAEAAAAKEPEAKENLVIWQPIEAADEYDIRLADGSIRPMSQGAIRSLVIELKKAGLIDIRHALDMLDIPDSSEIAEAVENELKLAALAKVQRK